MIHETAGSGILHRMTDETPPRLRREDGKPSVTAYVIAYNEAEKIEAAISSVLWADEIILADSH